MTAPDLLVLWRVTDACDLRCPFCGCSQEMPRARRSVDPDAVLGLGRILGQYARRSRRRVLVSLLGGEPLRWPAWHRAALWLSRECGLAVSLTTNGTSLSSPRTRRLVADTLDEIVISLDGLPPTHDALRGAPGLAARIEAAVRALRARRRPGRGPRIAVNTVLMRDTVRQFGAMCRILAEWGVETLTFNSLGGRERPDFHATHRLTVDDVRWFCRILPRVRRETLGRGLEIRGSDRYLARMVASVSGVPVPVRGCSPGKRFLFVDQTPSLSPCGQIHETCRVPLDEIRDAEDIARLPARFADLCAAARPAACPDCLSTQHFGKFQHGFCPERAITKAVVGEIAPAVRQS